MNSMTQRPRIPTLDAVLAASGLAGKFGVDASGNITAAGSLSTDAGQFATDGSGNLTTSQSISSSGVVSAGSGAVVLATDGNVLLGGASNPNEIYSPQMGVWGLDGNGQISGMGILMGSGYGGVYLAENQLNIQGGGGAISADITGNGFALLISNLTGNGGGYGVTGLGIQTWFTESAGTIPGINVDSDGDIFCSTINPGNGGGGYPGVSSDGNNGIIVAGNISAAGGALLFGTNSQQGFPASINVGQLNIADFSGDGASAISNNATGIVLWYGGDVAIMNVIGHPDNGHAFSVFADGTDGALAIDAGSYWESSVAQILNNDGTGSFANGAITWDAGGGMTWANDQAYVDDDGNFNAQAFNEI